jgi:hypothetical protein
MPAWLLSAVVLLLFWPSKPALEHLILLLLMGFILTELCLIGNQKIPFTCPWLPGKSNVHISFWVCIMLILQITLRAAEFERSVLDHSGRYAAMAGVLAAVALFCAIANTRSAAQETNTLRFEEQPSWQLTTLNLPR